MFVGSTIISPSDSDAEESSVEGTATVFGLSMPGVGPMKSSSLSSSMKVADFGGSFLVLEYQVVLLVLVLFAPDGPALELPVVGVDGEPPGVERLVADLGVLGLLKVPADFLPERVAASNNDGEEAISIGVAPAVEGSFLGPK